MKKIIAFVLALILAAGAFLAIRHFNNTPATAEVVKTTEAEAAAKAEAEAAAKAEAEAAAKAEAEVATTSFEVEGKTFFASQEAALEGSLQQRIDWAIMSQYKVYDIVREDDVIVTYGDGDDDVDATHKLAEMPTDGDKVTILRNGFKVLTWDVKNFQVNEKSNVTFKGAVDSEFTGKVFCDEHSKICARECVGYVNAHEEAWKDSKGNLFKGFRGPFEIGELDTKLFKAWVLVRRTIEYDGKTVQAMTWAVRTCCQDTSVTSSTTTSYTTNNGGKKEKKGEEKKDPENEQPHEPTNRGQDPEVKNPENEQPHEPTNRGQDAESAPKFEENTWAEDETPETPKNKGQDSSDKKQESAPKFEENTWAEDEAPKAPKNKGQDSGDKNQEPAPALEEISF